MVLHPEFKYRLQQQEILDSLPAAERRKHELLFSNANASYRYYQQADEATGKELTDYWEEWLQIPRSGSGWPLPERGI